MSKITFSRAVEELKNGKKVSREGWNGKKMFLFLIKNWTYTNGFADNYANSAFIAMKTAQDNVVPWLASQTDILSEDWVVLE